MNNQNSKIGYLNRLSVLPPSRRQGIGEELVNHIFNHAKSKGVLEKGLKNKLINYFR